MIAADTATYKMALAPVPSSEARPTLTRGFLTRLAVIAATSTPMKENRATPAAMPIAPYRLPPEKTPVPTMLPTTREASFRAPS